MSIIRSNTPPTRFNRDRSKKKWFILCWAGHWREAGYWRSRQPALPFVEPVGTWSKPVTRITTTAENERVKRVLSHHTSPNRVADVVIKRTRSTWPVAVSPYRWPQSTTWNNADLVSVPCRACQGLVRVGKLSQWDRTSVQPRWQYPLFFLVWIVPIIWK